MTVLVYLISDDLKDIYIYMFLKKELWAMGAE